MVSGQCLLYLALVSAATSLFRGPYLAADLPGPLRRSPSTQTCIPEGSPHNLSTGALLVGELVQRREEDEEGVRAAGSTLWALIQMARVKLRT